MPITAAGVGSGLDINGIVTQLMELERTPIYKLQAQNRSYDAQLSAYGKISSAVSSFETAMEKLGDLDKFKIFSSSSSDDTVLTATTDSNAAAGVYDIEVTRLAQNHKLGSAEILDANNSFSGTMDITLGSGTPWTVTVAANSSLATIRDKINSDATNPGVTASIINTSGGQHLILTAEESGQGNIITVDDSGLTDSGTPLGFTTINKDETDTVIDVVANPEKLDAAFIVDETYSLTSSSNAVTGVIDGITLNLKSLGTSTLQLSRDTGKIEDNVKEFVNAYNNLQKLLHDYSKGELQADSTVRSLQSQLRSVLNTPPSGLTGSYNYLSEIGILSDARTGELSLDSTDFSDSLDGDFQSVVDLFANNDQGYAYRFAELADGMLDEGRGIKLRQEALKDRVDYNEDKILNYEYRLEVKETALRAKYASLDSLIASMQTSSSFLYQLGGY